MNKNTPLAAYRRAYAQIETLCIKIPLLTEPTIVQQNGTPITWADVGSLTYVADLLKQAADFLIGEEGQK